MRRPIQKNPYVAKAVSYVGSHSLLIRFSQVSFVNITPRISNPATPFYPPTRSYHLLAELSLNTFFPSTMVTGSTSNHLRQGLLSMPFPDASNYSSAVHCSQSPSWDVVEADYLLPIIALPELDCVCDVSGSTDPSHLSLQFLHLHQIPARPLPQTCSQRHAHHFYHQSMWFPMPHW